MRKIFKFIACVTVLSAVVFSTISCSTKCNHVWSEATCTSPRTCTICSAVRDQALGHTGGTATCDSRAKCERCGVEYGEAPSHDWVEATCTEPRHCTVCLIEEGEKLDHIGGNATCIEKAICDRCHKEYGAIDYNNHLCPNKYIKTASGHTDHCDCCGNDIGSEEAHEFEDGSCLVCGYTPTIELSSVQTSAGQTVELSLGVDDTLGIAGLQVTVRFDPSRFTFDSVEQGEIFTDFIFSSSQNLTNGSVFMWDGMVNSVENGELLVLTFTVGDDVEVGEYIVEIVVRAYNESMNEIYFTVINGEIAVV